LIAAAPDILPPSNFNSGVMVVRPSTEVFQTMQRNAKQLTTFDGSDTGFLNAYYPTWYSDFPPDARLPAGYNAQSALYNLTADSVTGESTFWDAQLSHDLHIVHYSDPVKPWQVAAAESSESKLASSKNSLQALWLTWYQKSKNFLLRDKKERVKEEKERQAKLEHAQTATAAATPALPSTNDPKQIHKILAKRYKELRAQGMSSQEAMQQARNESQPNQELDAGSQVAAMFGMR
jgi:lipopolysaccharide biosynthesis glycosyltransferase